MNQCTGKHLAIYTSILPFNVSLLSVLDKVCVAKVLNARMMILFNSSGNISWTENFKIKLLLNGSFQTAQKAKLRLYVFQKQRSAGQTHATAIHCFVIKTCFVPILIRQYIMLCHRTALDGFYQSAQKPNPDCLFSRSSGGQTQATVVHCFAVERKLGKSALF